MSAPDFFNPDAVAKPAGPYAQAAWVKAQSDLLFISGQTGVRPDGVLADGLAAQAEEAFANIVRILGASALTPAHIVKLTIYAVAGQDLGAMMGAHHKALGGAAPTSTLIFVPQLAHPNYLIEIEAIAAR